jgi:hypothetical protein
MKASIPWWMHNITVLLGYMKGKKWDLVRGSRSPEACPWGLNFILAPSCVSFSTFGLPGNEWSALLGHLLPQSLCSLPTHGPKGPCTEPSGTMNRNKSSFKLFMSGISPETQKVTHVPVNHLASEQTPSFTLVLFVHLILLQNQPTSTSQFRWLRDSLHGDTAFNLVWQYRHMAISSFL